MFALFRSRSEGHIPITNYRSKEKSPVAHVHAIGCDDERYGDRGQRLGIGYGHYRREGCLGMIC